MDSVYTVQRIAKAPEEMFNNDDRAWRAAEKGRIDWYAPEGSGHRPDVTFRAVHDGGTLWVRFDVQDQYVRSVVRERHGPVCTDSCVEMFIRPKGEGPYYNFEVNAGGTLLASRIEDWTRTPNGFERFAFLPDEACDGVYVKTTLPEVIEPEHREPLAWQAVLGVPFTVFSRDGRAPASGDSWTANFYKCGDATSHPHWGAWATVGEKLDFHQPGCFGRIVFG